MKEEYFIQVKTLEEDIKFGLLDKITKTLGKGTEYYTKEGLVARSAGSGFHDYLHLRPHKQKDSAGVDATWYMFRITEFMKKQPYEPLKELRMTIESTVRSKLEKKLEHVEVEAIYHVTATDVPISFEMIIPTPYGLK